MVRHLVGAVPARTKALLFFVCVISSNVISSNVAFAQADDDEGWSIETVRARLAYYDQSGWGAQSQANVRTIDGVQRGSERLYVVSPTLQLGVRQNERTRHVVTMPVDIVTSASADALDAVSSASRVNEALELDVRTQFEPTDDDQLTFRYMVHIEEYLKGGLGGLGYRRELAQDNATISLQVNAGVDWFDPLSPQGFDFGLTHRSRVHASLSGSQTLTPTTLVMGGYDLTYQWHRLEQTWNSIPTERRSARPEEIFPDRRLRHALWGEVAQHIPASRSTLRGRYRYYNDDFDVEAHTFELEAFQWLSRNVYVRFGYRWHDQTSPSFFTTFITAAELESDPFRTADSDLGAFTAHEWNLKLVLFTAINEARGRESISISYNRYDRPFLDVGVVAVGYNWER